MKSTAVFGLNFVSCHVKNLILVNTDYAEFQNIYITSTYYQADYKISRITHIFFPHMT